MVGIVVPSVGRKIRVRVGHAWRPLLVSVANYIVHRKEVDGVLMGTDHDVPALGAERRNDDAVGKVGEVVVAPQRGPRLSTRPTLDAALRFLPRYVWPAENLPRKLPCSLRRPCRQREEVRRAFQQPPLPPPP